MEYIYLGVLFISAGLLAIAYYSSVPGRAELQDRLPNKPTKRAIIPSAMLILLLGAGIWYMGAVSVGAFHPSKVLLVIFALLVFESFFILSLRWFRSNTFAVLACSAATCLLFWAYFTVQVFFIFNGIVIIATLGAATLLVRLGYLRTRLLFIVTVLWVAYDVMLVRYVLPNVTVPADSPSPSFLFPAVTVGHVSLGSGDFMFLSLFTLVLLRDFGRLSAAVHVILQGTLYFITGLAVPEAGFLLPFLVIMAPAFFLVYGTSYYSSRAKRIS
ncbi:MAG: hypothetical protein WC505_04990 [Patescibacteria group bacterium]